MYKLLVVTIAATDTPQKVSATSVPCGKAIFQAQRGNSAAVLIGDDSVDSGDAEGFELNIPQTNVFLFPLILEGKGGNDLDLSNIYVAGTKDDVVNVLYYEF